MNEEYIKPLIKIYRANANKTNALAMKKYLRNQFEFYGMKMPLRRSLSKAFIKQYGLPPKTHLYTTVKSLWQLPHREYQYFAMELIERYVKQFDKRDIKLLEHIITKKSWWDTVDFISAKLVGSFFEKYPVLIKSKTKKWIESDNIWLQRTAILFQLKYKNQTDKSLLFQYINSMSGSKDFFIRKAIGWALREYAKTNPQSVVRFVQSNTLSVLSKKEALRRVIK